MGHGLLKEVIFDQREIIRKAVIVNREHDSILM